MIEVGRTWGTTTAERALAFPCDGRMPDADDVYFRGVDVAAGPESTFRWLCQLRVAPYSYDWIDNFGRRSPPHLTPGLERLAVGQRVMGIFELIDFEAPRHLTIRAPVASRERGDGGRLAIAAARLWISEVAVTYLVRPGGPGRCRLLAKVLVRFPRNPTRLLVRPAMPWLDLVMMRRQLLTLRDLAQRS